MRREGRVASEPALAEVSWPRQRFEYLIRVKASQLPDDNDAMLNYRLVEGEGEKVGGMGGAEELYATRASGCEQVVLSGSV